MSNDETSSAEDRSKPSPKLVTFVVVSSFVAAILFLLSLLCPLNVEQDSVRTVDAASVAAPSPEVNASEHTKSVADTPDHRKVFLLTTLTMFLAGMLGGCLANIRRIVQHAAPGPFKPEFNLSYYLRPLSGGIAGVVIFFLLLGGAMSLTMASVESTKAWLTLTGRAPYITFAMLAGYGSRELSNKLHDLVDALFALSKKKDD